MPRRSGRQDKLSLQNRECAVAVWEPSMVGLRTFYKTESTRFSFRRIYTGKAKRVCGAGENIKAGA